MPSFAEPPRSVCILRLSAIGDVCHVVPIVRTLQQAWPATQLTWIISKTEARLMSLIEGVEFIIVDKRASPAARRAQRQQLAGRRFEVLLHMQLALRASLLARRVRAPLKVGFDRARARELQWLFTNARIAPRVREHVLDSFFGFTELLGLTQRVLRWDLPLPAEAREYARQLIPDTQPTLVISPCSSHTLRNQIGKDTLPQLLALLARARVLVTPDSGPAHMATMVGTPVVGLYAATNPLRSGPYLSAHWCVNAYPEAARTFRGVEPEELPWTHKIEEPGVMALIRVDQVTARIDELLGSTP
jgi:heptosyltransferase I